MTFLVYLIGGIISLIFGLVVFIEGGFYHYGYFFKGRIPGIAAIIFGLLSFYLARKSMQNENVRGKHGEFLKCIECGNVYNFYEVENLKCKTCSSKVENIEGFFERHPEFKDKKRKKLKSINFIYLEG